MQTHITHVHAVTYLIAAAFSNLAYNAGFAKMLPMTTLRCCDIHCVLKRYHIGSEKDPRRETEPFRNGKPR